MAVTYRVKYYIEDFGGETLIVEAYETREGANSSAISASRRLNNKWDSASVWVDRPDGSETFLTEYVDGKE